MFSFLQLNKKLMAFKCFLHYFLLFIIIIIIQLSDVSAIQNTPTSLRSSREDIILSSSSFSYDKTSLSSSNSQDDELKSTQPIVQLETSKSLDDSSINEISFNSTSELTSPDDGLDASITASKNIEHINDNNIEVKAGEYYNVGISTNGNGLSGEEQGAPQGQIILSEPHQTVGLIQQQQQQVPRQGRQEVLKIYSDRVQPSMQTAEHRQANPDIQDIITGIISLLNGNVNVAANTGRPHKPIHATRINNRGPPRISDLPPLPPDFDTPGMNPPPLPADHPYPFETPPPLEKPSINQLPPAQERPVPVRPFINGVSVPESIVPPNKPWNRPTHRPGNRRPIPPYKPLPAKEGSSDLIDKDKDTSKSDNLSANKNDKENQSDDVKKKPNKYQPPLKQNKVVAENTLVLGSDLQPIPIPTRPENSVKPVIPLEKDYSSFNSSLHKQTKSNVNYDSKSNHQDFIRTTTLKIETSSSVQVIEPTRTIIEIQPTIVPLESNDENKSESSASSTTSTTETTTTTTTTVLLEPSKPVEEETIQSPSHSTPTHSLPSSKLESTHFTASSVNKFYKNTPSHHYSYRPRPGIVLDDTLDYTKSPGLATQRPYAPPRHPPMGDIFDVTVSAIQGPGGGGSGESIRVSINPGGGGGSDVILTTAVEGQGFVSIDGKRTYLNLFDSTESSSTASKTQIQATRTQAPPVLGTGYAVAQIETTSTVPQRANGPPRRPAVHRRPPQPPVRIDTCIVGDTSTCDASQHEACATVQGVSACHCKPGYSRLLHSLPCKKVVSIIVSIRVDRIYDWKIVWERDFSDKDSESHQTIAFESNKAIESAMSMTPFSDEYMGSSINGIYQGDVSKGQGGVFVNATIKLLYEPRTARPSLAGELQRHLLGVIHRRNNNIGNSSVFVDTPVGSISSLQDLDECASSELNDCNSSAVCSNNWGGFTCTCKPGLKDPHKNDPNEAGRSCISCPSTHCNNRGTCSYHDNIIQCSCTGSYYGTQCEIDGEVLGVAIGTSLGAVIIIIITVVCLITWSRRWSKEQKTTGSPVYGYMQGAIPGTLPGTLARVGSVGTLASAKQGAPTTALPPYLWSHIVDRMATSNLYATEPMGMRPNSTAYGYPTMSCHGTLPPVPLPRLQAPPRSRSRHQQFEADSSDSEPQDKDRADLIPQNNGFHVPRPKSRSSLANQSGIYYDVEYDQGDAHHLSKNNIPMSTYSMARPYYRT